MKTKEFKKFRTMSREVAGEIIRERGFLEYNNELDLRELSLENKTILDIGGGHGNFAKELAKNKTLFRNVKVFNVDPWPLVGENSIAAIAQRLPFKDNSFDIIVSLYAVPMYLEDMKDAGVFLLEIFRVLKRGGQARVAPFSKGYRPQLTEAIERISKKNSEYRIDYDFRQNGDLLILRKI